MYRDIKHTAKRALQHIAARAGRFRGNRTPQLLIVMYHRILPPEDERTRLEEPGMIVTPESLEQHIRILQEGFEPVMLSDWLKRKARGAPLPDRACAITFDDGWADNYEFAYPVLRKTSVPATIFLVSDMIGTSRKFWPERLARVLFRMAGDRAPDWNNPAFDWIRSTATTYRFGENPPSREEISRIVSRTKAMNDSEIHQRLDRIEDEFNMGDPSPPPALLDWEQLAEMTASGLVEAGSHTCNHTRLNRDTPLPIMEHEIIDSRTRIESRLGVPVASFCFPNGDYTDKSVELVRRYYAGSVTTRSGWNSARTDSYLLSRIGIHEDIARDGIAFRARISGWM